MGACCKDKERGGNSRGSRMSNGKKHENIVFLFVRVSLSAKDKLINPLFSSVLVLPSAAFDFLITPSW